jgi:hypothetical protein
MPQMPSVQVAAPLLGTLHAAPHVLQFEGSVVGSVQLLPQRVRPLSHSARHTPREHTCSAPQGVPQLPQWAGLRSVFTQALPHFTNPGRQVKSQVAPMHTPRPFSGASQLLPHAPQLAASDCVSTQALPQRSRPGRQVKSQTPAAQAARAPRGAAQALPHAPQ